MRITDYNRLIRNGLQHDAIMRLHWVVEEWTKRQAYASTLTCEPLPERNTYTVPRSHRGSLAEASKTFERFFGKTFEVRPSSLVVSAWMQGTHEDNLRLVEETAPDPDVWPSLEQVTADMITAWDDTWMPEPEAWVSA